jgi:ribosomal protein S18 acetylase RimI-like enzyme
MQISRILNPSADCIQKAYTLKRTQGVKPLSKEEACLYDYYLNKLLAKCARVAGTSLYLAKEKGALRGFALISPLTWDSKIFGFSISRLEEFSWRLEEDSAQRFLQRIVIDARREHCIHLNTRCSLKDFSLLNALQRVGFYIADIQVTLSANIAEFCHFGDGQVRRAEIGDLPQLRSLVRGAFTHTRFVADRRYPSSGVNAMYCAWIENSLADPHKRVYVSVDARTHALTGFLIYGVDLDSENVAGGPIGYIDLIAVAAQARGRGIGTTLVRKCLELCRDTAKVVEIRTQITNTTAIKAFMKAGFQEYTSGVVLPAGISLHYWDEKKKRVNTRFVHGRG